MTLGTRAIALLGCLAVAAGTLSAQADHPKPLDRANTDTTCAPCKDFFRYANGGWLDRNAIPGDQSRWGSFNELYERNYAALKSTLEKAASEAKTASGPDTRKLGTYYAGCMDSVAADKEGVKPLEADFKRIEKIKGRSDLIGAWVRLQQLEVFAPVVFHSTPDAKNSARVIGDLYQAGLGLPDRDYYTRDDSASAALRDKYVEHVTRMFGLLGQNSSKAAASARTVMGMETALARASMTLVDQRDPEKTYHLTKVADLKTMAPSIPWESFFDQLGMKGLAEVNVSQPDFLRAVDSLTANASTDSWKTYLRWQLLNGRAAVLSASLVKEDWEFRLHTLRGVSEMQPRWKRCLAQADTGLGEILGQAYVATNFSPEAKQRALTMVQNIQAEFRRRLEKLDWMSEETKTKAFTKLDAIINQIGYPDKWRDYSTLNVTPGPFADNVSRAASFDYNRDLAKIGKPRDKSDWGMTPPTVNAYYSPLNNKIVFPAGIMQPPFYDPAADDAVNYGGMGAVIGHEITHGFDDQGRQFDADGNLSGWWQTEDEERFKQRADVVVRQFDGYVAIDTLHVNGSLTLGENLADLGGLTIAYGAYRRTLEGKPEPAPIDGWTGDQRFFLAWAQIWRQLQRPQRTRLQVLTDPHSPGIFRVNGPLSNLSEFSKAFGCKAGDEMVRTERAAVW